MTLILLILLPASVFDVYEKRVPNILIISGYLISIYHNISIYGGMSGVLHFLIQAVAVCVLASLFYYTGVFGSGDIKLLSVIGSYYSIRICIYVFVVALFIGAILSVIKLIYTKSFIERFLYFHNYVVEISTQKKIIKYRKKGSDSQTETIPFALCIGIACLICMNCPV